VPEPDFSRLRDELIKAGMAPHQVRRTIAELGDHFDDLVNEAMRDGAVRESAELLAVTQLGPLQDVASEVRARPELRSWAHRFPRIAIAAYAIACVALLPVMPVFAGIANASVVARWTACAIASGLVTATIMLVLQLAIVLT
jgi:hypothetical protein